MVEIQLIEALGLSLSVVTILGFMYYRIGINTGKLDMIINILTNHMKMKKPEKKK